MGGEGVAASGCVGVAAGSLGGGGSLAAEQRTP